MGDTANLECRRIVSSDRELLNGLLAAGRNGGEGFGMAAGNLSGLGDAWGVFIRGALCGVAWLRRRPGGSAMEIPALLVARNWRKTGLSELLLDRLSRTGAEAGATEALIRLDKDAGLDFLEILADSGFTGPDPASAGYPAGEWRRSLSRADS
jgi:GNAT superfamily N-acetyltransferase